MDINVIAVVMTAKEYFEYVSGRETTAKEVNLKDIVDCLDIEVFNKYRCTEVDAEAFSKIRKGDVVITGMLHIKKG